MNVEMVLLWVSWSIMFLPTPIMFCTGCTMYLYKTMFATLAGLLSMMSCLVAAYLGQYPIKPYWRAPPLSCNTSKTFKFHY